MAKKTSVSPITRPTRYATGGSAPEPDMHVGQAGQWAFGLTNEEALIRALTTNTLSDTFYAKQGEVSKEFTSLVMAMAKSDPSYVAKAAVWASTEGNALNNTAPNVALAALAGAKTPPSLYWYQQAFPSIIRTPIHLFEHIELLRKGNLGRKSLGRGVRRPITTYLKGLTPYQVIKYHARANLRDIFRIVRPSPSNQAMQDLFGYSVTGDWKGEEKQVTAYERFITSVAEGDERTANQAIADGRLPWEAVLPRLQTQWPSTWQALVRQMPYTAILRNLGALTRHGVFLDKPMYIEYVTARVSSIGAIQASHVLPFQIYNALETYRYGGQTGRASTRGNNRAYQPDQRIVESLEKALELSFSNTWIPGNVLVITDVSGSMRMSVNNGTATCLDIASLISAAALKGTDNKGHLILFGDHAVEFPIKPEDSFMQIVQTIKANTQGSTNMHAGFQLALKNRIKADVVVAITDNMSWLGNLPIDALRQYRDTMKPKAIFLHTISPSGDSVAPINEPRVYQIAGWSASVPAYIRNQVQLTQTQAGYIRQLDISRLSSTEDE